MALSHVVQLFAQSEWIAEHLTQHPVLLDEFLDPRSLYAPLRKQDLRHELENMLAHIEDDDLEQQMEALDKPPAVEESETHPEAEVEPASG